MHLKRNSKIILRCTKINELVPPLMKYKKEKGGTQTAFIF